MALAPRPWSWLIPVLLVGLVLVIYGQVHAFAFVNIDDQVYVYENPVVKAGLGWRGLLEAFGRFRAANYHPLTWLSHQLDVTLFGLDAGRHHLVNVALHGANALLLWTWLLRLTARPWRSALVAALFAVHPLHVESVAWVSERKDVLSTFFLFLTLLAWEVRRRRPEAVPALLPLALLAAGLLSKPMLVTVPALLLLLERWPEPRPLRRATLLGVAPAFGLAAAAAVVTWLAQSRGHAAATLDAIPLADRLANGAVAASLYLWKAIWPAGLASFYPHPVLSGAGLPAWQVAASAVALAGISAAAWWARRRTPVLLWGWCWYLVTLLPVIGVVQVGVQAMADRYTYVPLIGPFVAVVWLLADALEPRPRWRPAAAALSVAVVLALALAAWRQTGTWRDATTLHRHALAVTERNWSAWMGLGDALADEGQPAEAIPAYLAALGIRPAEAQAWSSLGAAQGQLGRPDLAVSSLRRAVAIQPELATGWYNLGVALGALDAHAEAREAFERAVAIDPEDGRAWGNLATASLLTGDLARARACMAPLERLDPGAAARLRALLERAGP